MYTLPNNNFVRVALAVMKDATQVDSTMEDTMRPKGRNIFELFPTYIKKDIPLAHYLHIRQFPDGRVLGVEFFDSYHDIFEKSYNSLEIKLQPSETNTVGFQTREKCRTHTPTTHVPNLVRYGGIFSWLPDIGEGTVIGEPVLEAFAQYNGPKKWAYFNLEDMFKGTVNMEEIRNGKRGDGIVPMSPSDVDEINSKYQRLTSEVLAILEGKSDTITVS